MGSGSVYDLVGSMSMAVLFMELHSMEHVLSYQYTEEAGSCVGVCAGLFLWSGAVRAALAAGRRSCHPGPQAAQRCRNLRALCTQGVTACKALLWLMCACISGTLSLKVASSLH